MGPIFNSFWVQQLQWSKHVCQCNPLVLATERLISYYKGLTTWKDPYRDTPVSVYLNNCQETVENDTVGVLAFSSPGL